MGLGPTGEPRAQGVLAALGLEPWEEPATQGGSVRGGAEDTAVVAASEGGPWMRGSWKTERAGRVCGAGFGARRRHAVLALRVHRPVTLGRREGRAAPGGRLGGGR